ncbi:hypothetical protein EAF04_003402 [Stromatinia cepivora]|nr:hypothetical protein EAF04_003402 [Stromatinia cepivora]
MSEQAVRHRYSDDVDRLFIDMGTFRQLAGDNPHRPGFCANLWANLTALSATLQSECDAYDNRLLELFTEVDELSNHGCRMDVIRGNLSEEYLSEIYNCTSLRLGFYLDIRMIEVWRSEVPVVGQA